MIEGLYPYFLLLAEEGQQPKPQGLFSCQFMAPMVAIAVLWYVMMLRPQRRDQARRKDLLSQLKKNDRVVTIGGIIGTVSFISSDGKEVTLKLEDNARIRMLRSSIATVHRDDEDDKKSE